MQSLKVFSRRALVAALLSSFPLAGAASKRTKTITSPQLSQLTCATSSYTAAGTDSCSVTLTAPVQSSTTVSLSSNNSAVSVPSSVTLSSGTTASFTAQIASFTTNQTASITATLGSTAKSFTISLQTPTLSASPASIAFGSVTVNTKATQTVTLTPTGSGTVTVSSASVTGVGFSVTGPAVPFSLSPSQTATLTVTFAPITAGSASGQLTVASNSSTGNIAVGLSGTGEALDPVLATNSTSVPFGQVTVGQAPSQTIELTDTGNAAVTISSLSVSGSQFSTNGITTPYTLQPGQSVPLNLVFTPTSAASFTGTLTITSNAPIVAVSMSGTGEAVQHSVVLNWNPGTPNSDPAVGYNVYRAPTGSTSYQKMNISLVTPTTYTDLAVTSGQTYNYEITAVDNAGNESPPSNTYTVTIP